MKLSRTFCAASAQSGRSGQHRRRALPAIAIVIGLCAATVAYAASPITPSEFTLWGSGATQPYVEGGGICVPVGDTNTIPNYVGAQQVSSETASGMSFYGCFKGGSNAPDGSNEEAVFLSDDTSTWIGHEMGFIKTLSDNTLKAYIQAPGGAYTYADISTGDNGYHTFKCQVDYANHEQVDFYIDGNYVLSLDNGQNYWGNTYHMVGTTHRTSSGWTSSGQQIEMYDMTWY